MATIVKRKRKKSNVYAVVYRVGNKQVWKTTGKRRIDAEKLKSKIEHDLHRGIYQEVADISFEELANKWLKIKVTKVRPKTFDTYKAHIRRLIEYFGQQSVKNIDHETVEKWATSLSKEDYSPDTIGRSITLIKGIFKKGMQWGYLYRNPAEFIEKPKAHKREVDFLEPEEIRKLIETIEPQFNALVMFASLTGCRISEILGLRWSDIDFASEKVFIRQTLHANKFFEPKTEASKRTIDIPPILIDALRVHQTRLTVELETNDYDLVFPNSAGKPMDSQNLRRRVLEPALRLAGIRRVGFHALRHSYVSLLIAQGENIKTIQQLVGHSSAKVTLDTYSHLFNGTTKKAVSLLARNIFEDIIEEVKSEHRS